MNIPGFTAGFAQTRRISGRFTAEVTRGTTPGNELVPAQLAPRRIGNVTVGCNCTSGQGTCAIIIGDDRLARCVGLGGCLCGWTPPTDPLFGGIRGGVFRG
jgi:hypothetical protein